MQGGKAQILVVEDEALVGIDIREALENLRYNVVDVVRSGEEAIKVAAEKKPSIVLMDIMLSGAVDGIEAAGIIKANNRIPVVFLTAHADESTFSRAKVTEPYGYVLKPFRQVELRTVIELALHRHSLDHSQEVLPAVKVSNGRQIDGNIDLKLFTQVPHSAQERSVIVEFLKKVDPIKDLGEANIHNLSSLCYFQTYQAGDYLFLQGDKPQASFLIMSGRAALQKSSSSGKDLVVELLSPFDPFGLLTALEKELSPFSVKIQQETTVLWIPQNIVSYLMTNFPDLNRRLIDLVLNRLRKAHDLSRTLAHDRVEVRIASALLAMIPQFSSSNGKNDHYDIMLSRQELAEMTGTTPETASRVANALEREGILDLSKPGWVKILDQESLSDLIEE